jgi:hypothetical protein
MSTYFPDFLLPRFVDLVLRGGGLVFIATGDADESLLSETVPLVWWEALRFLEALTCTGRFMVAMVVLVQICSGVIALRICLGMVDKKIMSDLSSQHPIRTVL